MLYSYKGQYPKPLPFRIFLADGTTRTDSASFTDIEIQQAGFVKVLNKPDVDLTQTVLWDSGTLSWIVQTKTQEQLLHEYFSRVPKVITMRQARLALLSQGLLDTVQEFIDGGVSKITTDPDTQEPVVIYDLKQLKIEWEYSQTVDLNSPLVHALAEHLQLQKEQVYELFELASGL
jgi:hypothetical protein